MKVLVCGGREFTDADAILDVLKELEECSLRKVTLIISGGASGADECGELIAKSAGLALMIFPALWDYYQKAAGPIRNSWMLEFGKPDVVVAAPGGKGTANMIGLASYANIPVIRVGQPFDREMVKTRLVEI